MAGKPRIIQLTLDDLTLVTKGGPKSLTDSLKKALHEADQNNQVIYVRYSDDELQVMRIDKTALRLDPGLKDYVESEEYWT